MTAAPGGAVGAPRRSVAGGLAPNRLAGPDSDLASLQYIAAAARRGWRLWCAAALIGLLVGAAVYKEHPPAYQASTSLLLVQNPLRDGADQMQADLALIQSRAVGVGAMRRLGLPQTTEGIAAFMRKYTTTAVTDRVLQIIVSAPSAKLAVSWTKGIAAEFLQYRASVLQIQQQFALTALRRQITAEKQKIASIQELINAATKQHISSARHNKQQISPAQHDKLRLLLKAYANAMTSLAGTQVSAASYPVLTTSMIKGSTVLDSAALLPRSHLRVPILYAWAGMFGGLVAGLGFVILQALVSVRLRRRDDIAFALGAPVRLSVGRARVAGWQPGQRGLRAARSPEVQRIVAHLRDAVPGQNAESWAAGPAALAVVEVDSGPVAALSLASLAVASARDGQRVVVADLAQGAPAARLLGDAKPGVRAVREHGTELVVAVPDRAGTGPAGPLPVASPQAGMPAASSELAAASKSADLLLTLVTLDPSHGAEHLPGWAAHAVVVVTAGRSSSTKIHATAEMIRIAGVNLASCVLVGADPGDETLGTSRIRTRQGAAVMAQGL